LKDAYVDTSFLLAFLFGETQAAVVQRKLKKFENLYSSNLLEAELRSAFAREKLEFDERVLDSVRWVLPDRPLTPELQRCLAAGYARGADLWHLACALHLTETPSELTFMTLDEQQRRVAAKLGFAS
jgi:predicted nucleic acid-binding protein